MTCILYFRLEFGSDGKHEAGYTRLLRDRNIRTHWVLSKLVVHYHHITIANKFYVGIDSTGIKCIH